MEEEDRQAEIQRLKDPVTAYNLLTHTMIWQDRSSEGTYRILPMMGLISVVHVDVRYKWRKINTELVARAVRADGRADLIEFEEEEEYPDTSSGDRGYCDRLVRWQNLDDDGKPIKWRHLWTGTRMDTQGNTRKDQNRLIKMNFLYAALRNSARVRIVQGMVLEVNETEYDNAYKRLGAVLMGISENDPLWTKDLKSV